MEAALVAAVLCLAASTAFLALAIPLVVMYYLQLHTNMDLEFKKVEHQIDKLDLIVSELVEKVGVEPKE